MQRLQLLMLAIGRPPRKSPDFEQQEVARIRPAPKQDEVSQPADLSRRRANHIRFGRKSARCVIISQKDYRQRRRQDSFRLGADSSPNVDHVDSLYTRHVVVFAAVVFERPAANSNLRPRNCCDIIMRTCSARDASAPMRRSHQVTLDTAGQARY